MSLQDQNTEISKTYLKDRHLAISSKYLAEFKAELMQRCGWNQTQYFNRLHGKTRVAPLERSAIIEVFNGFTQKMIKDNESL